jgi:RNA polymerase sigma factor for flagellar operon FliA
MDMQRRIDRVWARYKRTSSQRLRDVLLEHYLPYVQKIADRMRARLPAQVQVEDLVSAGVFGLANAIVAYDPARQVRFTTFSARRIMGAMLDELRSMDWVPRQVRSAARQLDAAAQQFQQMSGRLPSEEETAKQLAVPVKQVAKMQRDAGRASLVSLDAGRDANAGRFRDPDIRDTPQLEDTRTVDPLRAAQKQSVKELVTKGLSRCERLVVILYYYEQLSMKEVGKTLDLSEARVSQIHHSIIKRLRASLRDWSELLKTDPM